MLPPWLCQCSWDLSSRDLILVYVRNFQLLSRSWSIVYLQSLWRSCSFIYLHHGYSDLCILYMVMTTYMISCIMHVLVAFCVEDLPYWWHFIYATSLIVPVFMKFQLSWLDSSICQTFPSIMEILIHCISSAIMEILILCISSSWRFWFMYIVHGDDHLCHILYHAYSWPLYSYVFRTAICICSYVQSCIIVLCW